MNKINDKYDVIIIGAGIGGLVCACYLAKAGLKALIIEKNDKAGGCCVSFKRNGIRFDAAAHVFGSCNEKGILYNILKRLGIKQPFVRLSPTDRFFFPNYKILIPTDINKYILLLQQHFPQEKSKINVFFEELLKIAKNIKKSHKNYTELTYQDFLDTHFQDARLKSILSAQAGYLGVIPKDVSVVSMCAMLSSYLKDGAYYPLGGASSFSNRFVERFISFGGNIIFNSCVTKLIINDNKVVGVIANNKKRKIYDIYADIVISNIDATQTLSELTDIVSSNSIVKENIDRSRDTPSIFILYLAVKIDKVAIKEKMGWHYPAYDINNNLTECIYITSPTLCDSTAARDDINVIEVFQLFSKSRVTKIKDWKIFKKEHEKHLLSRLIKIIPEIKDGVIIQESATSKTIENHTFNKNGAAYGWSLIPGQYDRNEAIVNAMPNNLYLTGHWTNPGGGILAVAISGYNTAKTILSNAVLSYY